MLFFFLPSWKTKNKKERKEKTTNPMGKIKRNLKGNKIEWKMLHSHGVVYFLFVYLFSS